MGVPSYNPQPVAAVAGLSNQPFSAFLLLLIGVVLLAQFVTGNLWPFLDGLLGTNTAGTPAPSSATPPTSKTQSYAGNSRGT